MSNERLVACLLIFVSWLKTYLAYSYTMCLPMLWVVSKSNHICDSYKYPTNKNTYCQVTPFKFELSNYFEWRNSVYNKRWHTVSPPSCVGVHKISLNLNLIFYFDGRQCGNWKLIANQHCMFCCFVFCNYNCCSLQHSSTYTCFPFPPPHLIQCNYLTDQLTGGIHIYKK